MTSIEAIVSLLQREGEPVEFNVSLGEFNEISVSSSNVESVGPYNPVSGVLHVTFTGGRTYRYHNVPIHEYVALVRAPSKGQHVNAFLAYSYYYERLS